jgi:cell division protein ZapB
MAGEYLPEDENRPRSNNVLIILLILLLIGSLGFNVYQYFSGRKTESQLNEKVVDSNSLRRELQQQRDSILALLEESRGHSSKLDSTIQGREQELIEKSRRIESLLKDNKISYNKYLSIKDQMEQWKYYAQKYSKEIDELKEQNKKLTAQNQSLKTEVTQKKHAIDTLMDVVTSQGNRLTLAERLTAQDVQITGVKFKGNNKERETDRAGQIEKLKICFTIPENQAALEGERIIYLQIIDPRGQTVSIDALGSGVTMLNGEQVQFTTQQTIQYTHEAKNYCIYWGKGSEFEKGKYTFNIITNGYSLGQKAYTIK